MGLRPLKPVYVKETDEWIYNGKSLSCKEAWAAYDIDFAIWLDDAVTEKEDSMARHWART